jgi:alpha,alpha-trehalase
MRRALGTLTPYPTLIKAIEANDEKALANLGLPAGFGKKE